MICFDNLIGIASGCTPSVPTSGKYLNTLAGVKMTNVSAALTSENSGPVDLLNDIITEATNDVIQEFRTIITPYLYYGSILENDNIGFYKTGNVQEAASVGNYRGIRVKIDHRLHPSLSFNLNSVTLKVDAALDVTVRIFDLMTGKEIDSFVITTVAGVPTIKYLNKKIQTYGQTFQIAIVYDAGVAGTFTTSANPSTGGSCAGCGGKYTNKYASFDGVTFPKVSDPIDTNLTTQSGTSGLSINYTLECDAAHHLCSQASILADPIRYKAAEKIFLELQAPSTRLNSVVTVQKKEVDYFYQLYAGKYRESIDPILTKWHPPPDECFYCPQKITSRIYLP